MNKNNTAPRMRERFWEKHDESRVVGGNGAPIYIHFRTQFEKFSAEGNVFVMERKPFEVSYSSKSYSRFQWNEIIVCEEFNFMRMNPQAELNRGLSCFEILRKTLRFNVKALINCLHKRRPQVNILIQSWWLLFVYQWEGTKEREREIEK